MPARPGRQFGLAVGIFSILSCGAAIRAFSLIETAKAPAPGEASVLFTA